jgi:ligand-binding sensor domain-containing protein
MASLRRDTLGGRRGRDATLHAALVLATALGGCATCSDRAPPKPPAAAKGTVRVRAITEAQPVRMLSPLGSYVFSVGTHGVDRWNPASGDVLHLSQDHGLPGDRVLAIAADVERLWLWMATDGGLGYYDVANDTFTEVPSTKIVDLDAAHEEGELHLAAATDGGVWIGHPRGLYYTNPAGQWTATAIDGAISALAVAEDGSLWMGTATGVVGKRPSGELFRYGPRQGLDVAHARLIARAPGGGVLIIGDNAAGKQRIAVKKGDTWATYKVSPDVTIDAVAPMSDALIARGGRRLYALMPAGPTKRRPLTRDGVRLLAVGGDASGTPPVAIELLAAALPIDATAVASVGGEVLVGTRDVGIGRWRTDATKPSGWLRRRQLLDGATTLTVACRAGNDCLLATGARRAWHYDGDSFRPAGPDSQAVLAVVRASTGELYALHRGGDASTIDVSRIDGDTWTPIGVRLTTPGDRPEVSFARFSPGGVLWVGLRYTEGRDLRPYGVALIDVALGEVAYHHETASRKERQQGVLPVPIDVADGAFASEDEIWLATGAGAARLIGSELKVWSEANGLASELTRAIAVSPGGFVFVATGAGIGLFDGDDWAFPRELSFPVNDMALAPDGRLWLATERGVALYDGKKVKRLDVRRGLLEDGIVDVAIDEHGRIWARGAESLTVVSP